MDFCDCNPTFTNNDPASEITIKPATKQTVEILVNEVTLQYPLVFIIAVNCDSSCQYFYMYSLEVYAFYYI